MQYTLQIISGNGTVSNVKMPLNESTRQLIHAIEAAEYDGETTIRIVAAVPQ